MSDRDEDVFDRKEKRRNSFNNKKNKRENEKRIKLPKKGRQNNRRFDMENEYEPTY